ncbi:MAG: hypothetical protein ACI9SY_000549 [Candidatus Paceibacteria bacterium]|jgi:hypothetical protein
MSLLFLGMTMSVIGKGMLGLAIIWVHITMATERTIDEQVIKAFRRETIITIIALLLIGVGYFLEVIALGGFTALLNCDGTECAAMIGGAI